MKLVLGITSKHPTSYPSRFRTNRHVALKVVKSDPHYTDTTLDEIKSSNASSHRILPIPAVDMSPRSLVVSNTKEYMFARYSKSSGRIRVGRNGIHGCATHRP